MLMSELAQTTGVPVHTLKYYLREGLLMPGAPTSRTRSEYGDEHVDRVRLVRALVEQGGVGIAGVHAILDALSRPTTSRHDFLGAAHGALPMPGNEAEVSPEVVDLLAELRWEADPECPPARALGAALGAARRAGIHVDHEALLAYAAAMHEVALLDFASVAATLASTGRAADALRLVVLGNVMLDPVLIALRRVAQEAVSAQSA